MDVNKLGKRSIEFDIKFKDFKFTDDFLLKGTFKTTPILTKVQFQHIINNLNYKLISSTERKLSFHFRLIMRPDLGEINFDGECIIESPEQNKIAFMIQNAPQPFRKLVDKWILKNCFYHAEEFAKKENFPFPPAEFLLKIPEKKKK